MTWREARWLFWAIALSFSGSGAFAAAVIQEPLLLTDLPWFAIAGAVTLAMAGGLVSTLAAIHKAAEAGQPIRVLPRLGVDLGMSLVIGFATYAVVEYMQLGPFVLLGSLPFLGLGGARIIDPLIQTVATRLDLTVNNLFGGPKR